jgi:N-acetylmuramoyl-L-alanine amidase
MNYTARTSTDFLAVHCSASKPSMRVDEDTIRQWHQARGWIDIGYNIVILRDGTVQIGRPIDYQGAHVEGFNSKALGICLVGGINEDGEPEDNFTPEQKAALLTTLRFCRLYARGARIQGHRDFPGVAKACPSFDVRAWLATVAPELL